jgi:hypothetical protein
MESIYNFISENQNYFTWCFGLVNALLLAFIYFNKKSHDRAIESLKHAFGLELERKKKLFGMKSESYESYFREIDTFFRNHQDDLEKVFSPLYQKFFTRHINASSEQEQNDALIWFNNELGKLYVAGTKEFMAIDQQTNALQLTASTEVADYLERLRVLYSEMFEISSQLMNALSESIHGNSEPKEILLARQAEIAENIKKAKKELLLAMRKDLDII